MHRRPVAVVNVWISMPKKASRDSGYMDVDVQPSGHMPLKEPSDP